MLTEFLKVSVANNKNNSRLARNLVLDEFFDLSLYRELQKISGPELKPILAELISAENRHFFFWQEFFGIKIDGLDFGRLLKLKIFVFFVRVFGNAAAHLILEAIEVYGVRKYLKIWEIYREQKLGAAVKEILEDEFKHEDFIVTGRAERKINAEKIRNIFLGFNDGLVELLGAVSGFFVAFEQNAPVLIAGLTVAVAGSFSMAAGVFVASGSEKEIKQMERGKEKFLGKSPAEDESGEKSLAAAAVVGISYFLGALVPIFPVFFGARNIIVSLLIGAVMIIIVSLVLAFLSGMDIKKRVFTNLVIIMLAVGVAYILGVSVKRYFGILI